MAATYPARPTTPAGNVRSHTGRVVHAGAWVKAPHTVKSDGWATPGWITAQACGNSHRAIAYGHPTDEAVTCKRCPAPAIEPEQCTACQGRGEVSADWSDEPVTCLDCYGSGQRADQIRELARRERQAAGIAGIREMQRRAGGNAYPAAVSELQAARNLPRREDESDAQYATRREAAIAAVPVPGGEVAPAPAPQYRPTAELAGVLDVATDPSALF